MPQKTLEAILAFAARPVPLTYGVVPNSVPIFYFGNYETARVATVGINPGPSEFKKIFPIETHPVSRLGFGKRDYEKLTSKEAKKVLDYCSYYFSEHYSSPVKKRDNFFANLETIVKNFTGCKTLSYASGGIVHIDLVPWATEKSWRHVSSENRNALLEESKEIFRVLLQRETPFKRVFLNGATAKTIIGKYLELKSTGFITKKTEDLTVYTNGYITAWNKFISNSTRNIENFARIIAGQT